MKNNKTEIKKEQYPAPEVLNYFLCVYSPFRNYKKGDLIHDASEINAILSCSEQSMVNKVFK